MKKLLLLLPTLALCACSGGHHDDLEKFVKDSGKGMRGKVEPLPEVKPYEPFNFTTENLSDPFTPRKLIRKSGDGGLQPPVNHRREALEAYDLEKLKMVGSLQEGKAIYGLVKAPDNSLYRVKVGNYLGTNYGHITEVTETEIKLTEIVENSDGDWTERTNSLTLTEESATPGKTK